MCAQEYNYGLKGGINYTFGELSAQIYGNSLEGSGYIQPGFGYQGGVFFELGLNKFFVRPEVLYTHSTGEFDLVPKPLQYKVSKLSLPLLGGYNIWGPVDIYAGIAYQYILNNKVETYSGKLKTLQSPWAGQVGIKYVNNKIEIDFRFDFTMDSKEYQSFRVDPTSYAIDDGRLNLFMLSFSYKLFDNGIPWRRKRSCYF